MTFLGALSTIARYDDLRCVPRLLCEVTAGGRPGYSSNQASPVPFVSKDALVSLLTVLNFVDDLPLLTFGRAALLGYTSRGDSRTCLAAYPTCPRDPDQLINYLNNHNGGFFRFFNQQLNAYLPQYAPAQGYYRDQTPNAESPITNSKSLVSESQSRVVNSKSPVNSQSLVADSKSKVNFQSPVADSKSKVNFQSPVAASKSPVGDSQSLVADFRAKETRFFGDPKDGGREEKSRYADLSIEMEASPGGDKIRFADGDRNHGEEPRIVAGGGGVGGGPLLTLDYSDSDYDYSSNRGGKKLVFSGSKESGEAWKFPTSSSSSSLPTRRPKKLSGGFAFPDNDGESSEVKLRPMVFPTDDVMHTASSPPEFVDSQGRPIPEFVNSQGPPIPEFVDSQGRPVPPPPSMDRPHYSPYSDYVFRPDRFSKFTSFDYDTGGFGSFDKMFGREQVRFL
nr:PREDICTED: uncharacterized protein LOC109044801 [Bemisia tabaci]